MCGLNFRTPRQIRDGPRQFYALRAMIGMCGQIELRHRRPDQTLTFILQLTKLPYLPHTHIGVTDTIRLTVFREALALYVSRGLYACKNGVGGFPNSITTQFFIIDARNFDMNFNTIEQWT